MKYVYYQQLFNDLWTIKSIFTAYQGPLNKLSEFLNEKYPKLSSLLDLDIDKAEREYLFWLSKKGIKTYYNQKHEGRKDSYTKTLTASFF